MFFIVPDVLLTCLAMKSLKAALMAALFAALGATAGGTLVWHLAYAEPEATMHLLLVVPGISEATFETVRRLLSEGIYIGMLRGAFTGVPYKIFAAEAGNTGINPFLFASLTPLVRLPRFVALSLVACAASRCIGERLSSRQKLFTSLSLWLSFYVIYFRYVGW
ncbi:hypothetical protein SADFL11_3706 [Roseibium alexandrii DFL-11]|uniref:Uncharacterized protein n=2 Tax=Roseibium alexandrii TaxID=388408 RepID=A0A5E8H2W9_ROSAD|nr:hypothetical protein SADFL11_3706 [Roseibium alexandrii DFL-11]